MRYELSSWIYAFKWTLIIYWKRSFYFQTIRGRKNLVVKKVSSVLTQCVDLLFVCLFICLFVCLCVCLSSLYRLHWEWKWMLTPPMNDYSIFWTLDHVCTNEKSDKMYGRYCSYTQNMWKIAILLFLKIFGTFGARIWPHMLLQMPYVEPRKKDSCRT